MAKRIDQTSAIFTDDFLLYENKKGNNVKINFKNRWFVLWPLTKYTSDKELSFTFQCRLGGVDRETTASYQWNCAYSMHWRF